jgi:diguanylate cyclase (GGDEF)-like protein
MVGRFGGDEFIAVTRSVDPGELEALESRLLDRVKNALAETSHRFDISFSFGYAVRVPEDPRSYEQLFIAADRQMYLNKRVNRKLQRRAGDDR